MKTIFIAFPLIFLGAKFISNMYETPDTSGPMMDSPAYSGEEVEPANEGSFWMALADNSNAAPTRSFRFGPSLPDEAIAEAPLNEAPTPAPTETDNVFQANKVEEPVVVKEEKVEEPVKVQAEPVKAEPVKAQPIKLVYEDNVIISTETDFDHILQKFEYAFVSFIVPWSSFCQTLRPEFQKAADIYAKKNKNVAFVWVDMTLNLALKEKYGVARYPTMMLFKKGNNKPAVFTNTRTSHAMETYLDSQVKPVNAKPAQKAKPAQNSKPTQNAKPAQNTKPAQNSKPAQNNTNQAQKPVSA